MNEGKIIIIDNVRSSHNVGSMFRTCDGAGVERVILGGYTPAPLDRFGRVDAKVAKTALGATEMIPWEHIEKEEDILKRITSLKEEGFSIVALEQTDTSISMYDFVVPTKVAYIVGNEVEGVSSALLSVCDTVVEIPMKGSKESLNVSVACGILLFHR